MATMKEQKQESVTGWQVASIPNPKLGHFSGVQRELLEIPTVYQALAWLLKRKMGGYVPSSLSTTELLFRMKAF